MAAWLSEVRPGDWFRVGAGSPFEVVAVDARAETVEVQYFDGTVAEIDFDSWIELAAVPVAQPEDPRGAFDMDRDDDRTAGSRWGNPLDTLDLITH